MNLILNPRAPILVLLASLFLCIGSLPITAAAAAAAARVHYTLQINDKLRSGIGEVCYQHGAPIEFDQGSFEDVRVLKTAAQRPSTGAKTMRLANADQCLEYTLRMQGDNESRGGSRRAPGQFLMLDLNDLLIRPRGAIEVDRTVSFILPSGIEVSAPGQQVAGYAASFRLLDRPTSWRSGVLIGELSMFDIAVAGGTLRCAISKPVAADTREKLKQWVTNGARAITRLYGKFPLEETQILLVADGPSNDPVPWGEVTRGGGDAVHLFVDETKNRAILDSNWVLVHELSHLLHPYALSADSWLSEGIASYYQNVLRARAGLIDSDTAWQKLDSGFRRAEKQFEHNETLANDTRKMMRNRKYMRVYWSGAALALIADTMLRTADPAPKSLDAILEQIAECCLPTTRRWSGRELLEKMDASAGSSIFRELYDSFVMMPAFPDLTEAYQRLGISRQGGGVTFDDAAPAVALRSAIMRGL